MCSIELEQDDAVERLQDLSSSLRLSQPREVVRAAAYTLSAQLKFGHLDLARVDLALDLLPEVSDPLVESAFRNIYSAALALSAEYDEALQAAECLMDTVRRYRLEFVVPYALSVVSVARAGRREWAAACDAIDLAATAARDRRNSYAEQICYAIRVRTLGQQGRHELAVTLPVPDLRSALPAARGEALASRALILAAMGNLKEAQSAVEDIRGKSSAIEPVVLVAAVDAVVSLKRRGSTAVDDVSYFVDEATRTGALDLLVSAYRSAPELLEVLLRSPQRPRVIELIRRVRDEDLAEVLGQHVRATDDPRARLTRREREVFDLLVQGFSNRQIGKLLFIEESTVKVHAHHIYDKLGTRSRTALAVQAALERADHATRATGTDDSAEVPDAS
jgi:DNA-binding NarL/FixJ family response regulator